MASDLEYRPTILSSDTDIFAEDDLVLCTCCKKEYMNGKEDTSSGDHGRVFR